jgi:hypothetical protein
LAKASFAACSYSGAVCLPVRYHATAKDAELGVSYGGQQYPVNVTPVEGVVVALCVCGGGIVIRHCGSFAIVAHCVSSDGTRVASAQMHDIARALARTGLSGTH